MDLEFEYLYNSIYFIIPVLTIIILILSYKKRDNIISQLPYKAVYKYKWLKSFLIVLGIILIVFSLLGPQVLKGYQEVEKEGLDLYVLIDTSKSMLVEDVQPNRLRRAKKTIEKLLDSLEGDRIGFIPFASDAYIQMPLTSDYRLAEMFLEVVDTEMMAGGGTDLSSALNLASESFQRSAQGDKVVLIFSDGETHDNNGLEIARKQDEIKIYTVGVGTEKGGLIPIYDDQGNRNGYQKNNAGEHVVSKFESEVMQELAKLGNGDSYSLSNNSQDIIQELNEDLSQLKRGQIETSKIKSYNKLFQYFLGIGILLFVSGYLLAERRD
jgi:Ca-activated chloride channel family protein